MNGSVINAITKESIRAEPQASAEERHLVAVLSLDALLAKYRQNEFAVAAKYGNVGPLGGCRVGAFVDECRVVETAGSIRDIGRNNDGVA